MDCGRDRTGLIAGLDPALDPGRLIERILTTARAHLKLDVSFVSEVVGGQRIFRWSGGRLATIDVRVGEADPLEDTFCSLVVDETTGVIVPDAGNHPLTADQPASARRGAGCYIGVPITLSDGRIYGTMCCLGSQPNTELGVDDVAYLRFAAELIAAQVERDLPADSERGRICALVSRVIADREVRIEHQPILRLHDGALLGVEALARFSMPAPQPAPWFYDAWSVGLGPDLELCALRCALATQRHVPDSAFLAVNLSPETLLRPDLDSALRDVAGDRIVIEVAEHAAVVDYTPVNERLDELRDRGFRVALDDLGSGHAGLRHVVELRPDVLKIDRQVVRGVRGDSLRRTVAAAIATTAAHMGALVVAEGIETSDERDALEILGVTAGQGFHLGTPASPTDSARYGVSSARAKG